VPECRNARNARKRLLEELETLHARLFRLEAQTRDVSARPSKARYEPRLDGIHNASHDDGDRCRGGLGGLGGGRGYGHGYVDPEGYKFFCKNREPLGPPPGIPRLDGDVLSLYITKLTESVPERFEQSRRMGLRGKHTNPIDLACLLRLGDEWRMKQAECEND